MPAERFEFKMKSKQSEQVPRARPTLNSVVITSDVIITTIYKQMLYSRKTKVIN